MCASGFSFCGPCLLSLACVRRCCLAPCWPALVAVPLFASPSAWWRSPLLPRAGPLASCLPRLSIDLLLMAVSLTPRQFCCALWSPSSSSSSCELMEDRGCCDSMLFVGCLAQAARVFCAHAWRNCNNSWPPLRPCNGIIPLARGRSLMVRSLCVCPFS